MEKSISFSDLFQYHNFFFIIFTRIVNTFEISIFIKYTFYFVNWYIHRIPLPDLLKFYSLLCCWYTPSCVNNYYASAGGVGGIRFYITIPRYQR